MPNYSHETPRQLLNRKIEEYREQERREQKRLDVLKAIVESAQETENGFTVHAELIKQAKQLVEPDDLIQS